ncbi:hypothetical protein GLYMA_13G083066v4 [Glycine max]|nr:hypothetical protein GLYMA_13G083066v4 [Glycine max]KAH1100399.1 hypothetical protein GYH30_035529 [Glycine max]
MNIFVMVISWLLHRCCVCTSSCYCHELLGSGYVLHDPTIGAKMFLSQMDRILVLLSKGPLLCQRVFCL